MNAYRSFGLFGLVILAFGLLAGVVTGDWTLRYVLVHLIVGTCLLGLYLFTHVETLRESVSGRTAQHGTNTVVYTLLTLGVLVAVNFLVARQGMRYDATEQGIFSIASQTRQALQGLERDVEVLAFFREAEPAAEATRRLLDSYAAESDRFTFEMVDPDREPERAEQMEVTQYGTLVLTDGEESTRITESTEEALTNALIRFSSASRNRIYFVVGHGEGDPTSRDAPTGYGQLTAALENEGNEVETLLLSTVPDVPADADLLVVGAPQRPWLESELAVLERHLDRGGATFFLLDPRAGDQLQPLLAERGVALGNDVVVDPFMQIFAGPRLGVAPVVEDYGIHPVTTDFGQRTVFNMARSVTAAEETPDGVSVTTLARTGPNSWAESDVDRLFEASEAGLDEGDTEGPVSIAVAATLGPTALSWTEPAIDTRPGPPPAADETVEDAGDGAAAGEATGDEAGATGETAGTGDEAGAAGETTGTGDAAGATDETTGAGDAAGTTGDAAGAAGTGAQAGDPADAAGPATPPAGLEGRLVVFGDSDWVNNSNIQTYFNEDLFLNAVGWLVGQEELISIRPRSRRASRITLTQGENWAVFYSSVLLLPEIVLLAGLAIWWRRRR